MFRATMQMIGCVAIEMIVLVKFIKTHINQFSFNIVFLNKVSHDALIKGVTSS